MLYGLRGVGKTVLVRAQFEHQAGLAGWETAFIEARPGLDFQQTLVRKLVQALRRLIPSTQAAHAVRRAFAVLTSVEVTYAPEGWKLGVKATPEPGVGDSGDFEADLSDLLAAVGQAARASGSGLAILIDEMQLLEGEALEALVAGMHRLSQERLPLCLVGAGLPQLPGIIATAKTYAERLFTYLPVDDLSPGAAREALQRPAGEAGVAFSDEALDRILAASGRYPYFLQVYGKHAWDAAAQTPIGANDVERILPDVRDELDSGFFHVRWDKATAKERTYMVAMALLGDGPQKTPAIAARLGRKQSDISTFRDSLIKKGLIYRADHGFVDFTAPLFGDYLRRHHRALVS